jgi:hypothetical protein
VQKGFTLKIKDKIKKLRLHLFEPACKIVCIDKIGWTGKYMTANGTFGALQVTKGGGLYTCCPRLAPAYISPTKVGD